MRKTLIPKCLVFFGCFFLLSFLATSILSSTLLRSWLVNEATERMYRSANEVAAGRLAADINSTNLTDAYNNLSALADYEEVIIQLVNSQGEIVLDTSTEYSPNTAIPLEGFDTADWAGNYYIEGNFYGLFDREMRSVIVPITSELKTRGYVVMHCDLSDLNANRYSLVNICYLILGSILLLSLILLAAFYYLFYRPLGDVITAAQEYAAGNLTYPYEAQSNDEIGFLGANLQYMAAEISQSGEYQRKFISNISHDFRSPLTSIKGYVEAILDGTIPPEMQERYLKIVVTETERLNKLTANVLTLNNFDDKKVLLNLTDFDINQIIRLAAASFEGLCAKKEITFQLTFDNPAEMVNADMDRIQQVLYNLIDNAIKFSPPSSVIYLGTASHHGKILVSVKDTGEGIPAENIDKIWERFYKGDSSRGRDKKGTGLGLAITREIIQAHGEHINVVSTIGIGTEFTFTLRSAEKK